MKKEMEKGRKWKGNIPVVWSHGLVNDVIELKPRSQFRFEGEKFREVSFSFKGGFYLWLGRPGFRDSEGSEVNTIHTLMREGFTTHKGRVHKALFHY